MRVRQLLENQQYIYHVTFTENVPRIKEKGLLQFQPSNWVRAGNGKRYNEDAGVFAFEDPEDAFRWAFKMGWDFKDADVSIVRLNMGGDWHEDPSEDVISKAGAKGRWLRSSVNRPADEVIDAFRMKDFSNPAELGVTQDEWIKGIVQKLTA